MDTADQNKSIKNRKIWILDILLFSFGILLDQLTKRMAIGLKSRPIILIADVLQLRYVENRGAAFGIFQGQRIPFIIIFAAVFIVFTWLLVKLPPEGKYNKLHIALSLILAGAVGNTIDRVIRGYVIDFIYFEIINFPVFNAADIYITVTTIWLAFIILFVYKDSDFDFLRRKSHEERS